MADLAKDDIKQFKAMREMMNSDAAKVLKGGGANQAYDNQEGTMDAYDHVKEL